MHDTELYNLNGIVAPLSWQDTLWQQWCDIINADRLPHALLLNGDLGIGKRHFAKALMHFVLCENTQNYAACGTCRSCLLNTDNNHPDSIWIDDIAKSKERNIDAIRALIDTAHRHSHQNGWRVIVIIGAHTLSPIVQNALLKILEEPKSRTLFLLHSNMPHRILVTIRSRCQQLLFAPPAAEESLLWLSECIVERQLMQKNDTNAVNTTMAAKELQNSAKNKSRVLLAYAKNRPFVALSMYVNNYLEEYQRYVELWDGFIRQRYTAVHLAKRWMEIPVINAFEWLLEWLIQCIVFDYDANKKNDFPKQTVECATNTMKALGATPLNQMIDKAMASLKLSSSRHYPNHQMLLEELLLYFLVIIVKNKNRVRT